MSFDNVSTKFPPAYRTAITIPEKSWGKFRDVFDDYVDKMKEATEADAENTEKE